MRKIMSADILQRKVSGESFGYVGLIALEEGRDLEEGLGYLVDLSKNPPVVYSDPILEKPEYYEFQTVDSLLKKEIWCATSKQGYGIVRSIPIGRDSKELIIYGSNTDPLIPCEQGPQDTLGRFRQGSLYIQKAPKESTYGMNLGQCLQLSGLFLGPSGERSYFSRLPTSARRELKEITKMRIRLANKEISRNEFDAWSKSNPLRDSLNQSGDNSQEFLDYLKNVSKSKMSEYIFDWMTEGERNEYAEAAKEALNKETKMKNQPTPPSNFSI